MTSMNIYRSLGGLDPDLIAKAAPAEKARKKKRNTWIKWVSLAACFCLAMMTTFVGGQSSTLPSLAIVHYEPFIFVPVLIVSFIPLLISFVKKETTLKSSLLTSANSLVAVNILNVLGVHLYSQLGGIHIFGSLPVILISSNIGAVVSVAMITLLDRKIKAWWIKLLLWVIASMVAILLACLAHLIFLTVLQGDRITVA